MSIRIGSRIYCHSSGSILTSFGITLVSIVSISYVINYKPPQHTAHLPAGSQVRKAKSQAVFWATLQKREDTGRRKRQGGVYVQSETRSHVHRLRNTHQILAVTFWCTLSASVIAPIPQSVVTFTQHESGTEFPSLLKPFQSEELFTPQHFIWKSK